MNKRKPKRRLWRLLLFPAAIARFGACYYPGSSALNVYVDDVSIDNDQSESEPTQSTLFSPIYLTSQAKNANGIFGSHVIGQFNTGKFQSNLTGTIVNQTVSIVGGWLNVTKTIPNTNNAYFARFFVTNATGEYSTDRFNFVPQNDNKLLKANGPLLINGQGLPFEIRSMNKVEMADNAVGTWLGDPDWNEANVESELTIMKNWGANTIRLTLNTQDWIQNSYAGGEYARTAIKRVIEIANDLNLYVSVTNYRVLNLSAGAIQDPLPYPPYQGSAEASNMIGSQQEFVNFCASEAMELRQYSNVLFEIWNEPFVDGQIASWRDVTQQVITAMRNKGFTAPIIIQWDRNSWVNLDYPAAHSSMDDWVEYMKPIDITGNNIFSTHAYRTGDGGASAFFHGTYANKGYTLQDLIDFYSLCGLYNVSRYYPVYLSETGVNMDLQGIEMQHELTSQTNLIQIAVDYHINVGQHWFRELLQYRMRDSNFNPTAGGQVFIDAFT